MNKNRNIWDRQIDQCGFIENNSRIICETLFNNYSLRLEAERDNKEWFSYLESGNQKKLNKLTKEFLENDSVKRPWHLHITIQPRFYDRLLDEEMKELITHSEYLLSRDFIKGPFHKYCLEDRFHGFGCFHSEKESNERHCHIVFYIPFHMMSMKTKDGWVKMTGSRSFLTEAVRQRFLHHYIKVYSMDDNRLWQFRKSYMNKDGSVNEVRKTENTRLRIPYLQCIEQTEHDRKRVIGYDMKEAHLPNRLDDLFYTNNNKRNNLMTPVG